jgi:alkyldihydroxyacetonephosphate synthase
VAPTRFAGPATTPSVAVLAALEASGAEVLVEADETREASRDWWPLALHWALRGQAPAGGAIVVRPTTTEQVAAVMRIAHEAGVPVTAAGGRSGVCGASVPLFGGIVLDLTRFAGLDSLDAVSGLIEVRPGTFGPDLEAILRPLGFTLGHWPQSMAISTVGGWLACRGAGQYSTRYGKIEDMVVGLEVVLADGRVVTTGGAPRGAAGPDLTQLFVGSEGTLGIITSATLRVHPLPGAEGRVAFAFADFGSGIDACRRILQRGATPAVLRLYDGPESKRSHGGDGTECYLLVLDEADPVVLDATMAIVNHECVGARPLDIGLVEAWLHHRNDTSGLQALSRKGFVVDTMEVAAPWSQLDSIFDAMRTAILAVPHSRAATAHLSHSYRDGACIYVTFAATPPTEEIESTYIALWDAGQRAALRAGANLSHHHGVGLNRGRFMAEALGTGLDVLTAVKAALDPTGILNPGKLGLPTTRGVVPWA